MIGQFVVPQQTFAVSQTCRRHFILMYDNSAPFYNEERKSTHIPDVLGRLFENESIEGVEGNTVDLERERKRKVNFFDPEQDEISFFFFGLNEASYRDLSARESGYRGSERGVFFSDFQSKFIRIAGKTWREYREETRQTPREFINYLWGVSIPFWGNGVTLSNLVIPSVFHKNFTSSYAEEYIVVIVSDFLSGDDFGNRNDRQRIKEIFPESKRAHLRNDVYDCLDRLGEKFYKINYFELAFDTNLKKDGATIALGILGYKIRPKAGGLQPENITAAIDSEIKLEQLEVDGQRYELLPAAIRFTHNEQIEVEKIRFLVDAPDKREVGKVTISNYRYDKESSSYFLGEQQIDLPNIDVQQVAGQSQLTATIEFLVSYKLADSRVNLLFRVPKTLRSESFLLASKTIPFTIAGLILVVSLMFFLIFIVIRGKPVSIGVKFHPHSDTYEKIDFASYGKLQTPYKAWDSDTHLMKFIGFTKFKKKGRFGNWKRGQARVILDHVKHPDNLDVFLRYSQEDTRTFYAGESMKVNIDELGNFGFQLQITSNDDLLTIAPPELIDFKITIVRSERRFIFFNVHTKCQTEYRFHVGEDLDNLWIGLDPGTSGSCIAAGRKSDGIMPFMENGEVTISPSVLCFDPSKSASIGSPNALVAKNVVKTGLSASRAPEEWPRFYSIKKLLGYSDKQKIEFASGTREFTGAEMSSMLIQGLMNDFEKSLLDNPGAKTHEVVKNGQFTPRRAVVAVPNNFTLTKIQDMLRATKEVVDVDGKPRFAEVRYVYEAEAVLFHYINNYKRLGRGSALNSETVFVLDMGGATINVTVAKISLLNNERQQYYNIDILAKLGFGIGGDTIDYCLTKFFEDFEFDYDFLKGRYSPSLQKNRRAYQKVALDMKREMLESASGKNSSYVTPITLNRSLRSVFKYNGDTAPSIAPADKISSFFKKQETVRKGIDRNKKRYKSQLESGEITQTQYDALCKGENEKKRTHRTIFEHNLLESLVYDSVQEATQDVLDLATVSIDTVIYSGRSTFFPKIREKALKTLTQCGYKDLHQVNLSIKESKSAVAEGACWYGVNKSGIRLNNLKTNGAFGVCQSTSGTQGDVKFIELIKAGQTFSSTCASIGSFKGIQAVNSNFQWDNNTVNFYQVMGTKPEVILSDPSLKHKYTKIASVRASTTVSKVAASVNEIDEVKCHVQLGNDEILKAQNIVSDMEISKENEEHYTWYV